jgi:hypothetical protein
MIKGQRSPFIPLFDPRETLLKVCGLDESQIAINQFADLCRGRRPQPQPADAATASVMDLICGNSNLTGRSFRAGRHPIPARC